MGVLVKVLVAEKIADAGVELLREDFDVELGLDWDLPTLEERIGDFDALIVRSATKVTADLIAKAPNLKVVGRAGTGVDNVDLAAATKRGILVVNAPESNSVAAAEHTLALALALARNVPQAHRALVAGEVARRANYDEANTYTVLAALEKAGLLEVTQENPRKWRVGRQHRRNRVLRASHLVNEGEWITYGDFAIAVYGNVLTARTVGRVAAKNPTFANAHRVIGRDGVIPQGWQGFGGGPEECRRRLEADGVTFKDGKADREHQISWETLKDRLDSQTDDGDE